MIVEQPPANPYGPPPAEQAYAPPPAQPASTPAPEVKPGEPTVLVFRNGKQQEVTNYAIMGDTLYVFDKGRTKIAMADLDIPATVQANDDRGMEFRVPPSPKKKVTATPSPQSSTPDNTKPAQPPNIAALLP
jgi:endonuclease YncB( thermonuclease family)